MLPTLKNLKTSASKTASKTASKVASVAISTVKKVIPVPVSYDWDGMPLCPPIVLETHANAVFQKALDQSQFALWIFWEARRWMDATEVGWAHEWMSEEWVLRAALASVPLPP